MRLKLKPLSLCFSSHCCLFFFPLQFFPVYLLPPFLRGGKKKKRWRIQAFAKLEHTQRNIPFSWLHPLTVSLPLTTNLGSSIQLLRRSLEKASFPGSAQAVPSSGWQDRFVSIAAVFPAPADRLPHHSGNSASNGQAFGKRHLHLGTTVGKATCCWQKIWFVWLFPLQHPDKSSPVN